jgi:hypothetical protein
MYCTGIGIEWNSLLAISGRPHENRSRAAWGTETKDRYFEVRCLHDKDSTYLGRTSEAAGK